MFLALLIIGAICTNKVTKPKGFRNRFLKAKKEIKGFKTFKSINKPKHVGNAQDSQDCQVKE